MDSLKEQIRSRLSLLRLIPAMLKRKPWREKRFFLEKTLFGKRRFESYSNVSGYLSISPNISLELERFPIERNKIVPIHNGVDVHRFRPVSENEKKRLKANIGVSEETLLITLAARFAHRKRFPDLIQAWSFLASRFPRHLLLLAGDGPERSPCERLAVQLGLESRIRFLGFRLSNGRDSPGKRSVRVSFGTGRTSQCGLRSDVLSVADRCERDRGDRKR